MLLTDMTVPIKRLRLSWEASSPTLPPALMELPPGCFVAFQKTLPLLYPLFLISPSELTEFHQTGNSPMSCQFRRSPCHDVQSLQPISLLSILSKCLEKHLYQLLLEHFESNFVLSESQFGFRKGRSTIIPLMVAVHHWHHFLERKQQVLCVFFDIRKAFNSVPHQALLNKLSSLDVPFILLRWVTSYLTSRLQRVVLGGVSSPWLPVKSGIPQGSVYYFSHISMIWHLSLSPLVQTF